MPKASWNGVVIADADADNVLVFEGSIYFPPESVDRTYLRESRTQTVCPVKGIASYYDVLVEGELNHDAAWFYASPKLAAEEIAGYVAFWKGVTVEQED